MNKDSAEVFREMFLTFGKQNCGILSLHSKTSQSSYNESSSFEQRCGCVITESTANWESTDNFWPQPNSMMRVECD